MDTTSGLILPPHAAATRTAQLAAIEAEEAEHAAAARPGPRQGEARKDVAYGICRSCRKTKTQLLWLPIRYCEKCLLAAEARLTEGDSE